MEEAQPRLRMTAQGEAKRVYQLPSARVLLADDGEANRQLASLLLTRAGLSVVEVENGAQAVEEATARDFDLVLMDMQMPIMDGWTATRTLRENGFRKPIIALTAAAMLEDSERCYEAGCDDFLTKPIELDRLMEAIGKALGVEPELVESSGPIALPTAGADVVDVPQFDGESVSDAAEVSPSELAELCAAAPINEAELSAAADALPTSPIFSSLPTDDPEFREIVAGFISKLRVEMQEIHQTATMQQWDELARKAHWLKGSAGTMGFHDITQPAMALEQSAQAQSPAAVEAALEILDGLVARIHDPKCAQPVG